MVRGLEGLPRPGGLARGKGPGQGGHHHTYDLTNYDLLPCIIDRISIKLTIIIRPGERNVDPSMETKSIFNPIFGCNIAVD